MDFVVANGLTNDLWIYLGKGDGTFELPQIIPLSKGLSPVGLAVGDFHGKGNLDLVVAEADSSTIGVLPGNGDGTFGYEQEYALPEPPASVVVDDFNHDGKMDIAAVMVTTEYPGATVPYIALLTGDGTGKFGTPIITPNSGFYSTAWNIASGDVNGDGLPDLLITGPGYENAQVFLSNGDGTFNAGAIVVANDPDVGLPFLLDGRLADINGDGCADAVVADLNTMVWVSLGDCSGNFTKPVAFYMGSNIAAVRLADVNGDGHLDLVTAAFPGYSGSLLGLYGGNSLNVALGDGKGNFGTARIYAGASQAYSIGIADFNGDGKPDFVTANNDTDTVTVYQNDGAGGFGFPQGIYAGVPGQGAINAPRSALSFADLNNDGRMDAFFLDTGDRGISGEYYATGFLNDGTGKLTGPISSDTGIARTTNVVGDHRLGDFRNTGKLDLVAIGQVGSDSTSFNLFLTGNGDGTFAKGTPVYTTGANGIMAVADFNKDGKLDFVSVNGSISHTLTTFLGNGNGTFRALAPITFNDTGSSTGGTNAIRAYTGDFNRDGKLDVLVFTSGNGYWTTESTVWEFDGNGDGTFQSPRQLVTGFQPFALADVNGDGYLDIARYDYMWPDGTTQTEGPSKFTTYLGQADGSFVQSSSYAPYAGIPEPVQPFAQNGDPLSSSLVGDFNGDGKPEEVAFQAPALGTITPYAQFLMGNGDGTFTPTYDIFPFYGGYPVYVRDLDGDGIADMLELDNGTSSLRVYKGGHAPALQMELEQPVVTGNSGCGWVFPDVASSSSQIVTLSSSIAGVSLPASVTVSPGALSARFCYALASNFNWRQVFDINAQLNGDTATAYASDSYVLGFSEVVSPASLPPLYAGQSTAPLTLTLTSSQGYSSTANLYCEGLKPGESCQFGSNTLNVSPVAAATTTVTLVTAPNPAVYGGTSASFTIVADDGNVIQRQTVAVGVAGLRLSPFGVATVTASSPGSGSLGSVVWGIPPYQLSCSGLPAGAMCSFSGDQLAYPSSSLINVSVNVPAGIAAGNYPFTVNVASQTYTASGSLTLQVVGYSVQGPPASNSWLFPGTTHTVPLTVQGSSNWNGAGQVTISCSLDVAATCTGGSIYPGVTTASPFNLSINVPAGTPLGTHRLTVNSAYGGSTQTYTFPLSVVSFNGSVSATSLTIERGGSGTLTATLNATAGFVDSVNLQCSGAPQIACTFNPPTPAVTGGSPAIVTITFTANTTAELKPKPARFSARSLIALASLLPLILFGKLRPKGWPGFLMILLGFALLSSVGACSGGGGGGSNGPGSNTYSVTVTAGPANTTVQSTLGTVTLTVNH